MDTTDDNLRPAYIEKANNNHIYRPDKLQYELHIPNGITRSGVGFSGVIVLFFVSLCVTAIFSCIIFRLWLSGMHENKFYVKTVMLFQNFKILMPKSTVTAKRRRFNHV